MYDSSNEPREFVAADREEAIAKACEFFRRSADALAIHEPDPKEIFGLASRAVIVAAPLDRRAPPREARERGRPPADEGRPARRGRDGGGGGGRERGGRGDGRGGRDRGERDRGERSRGGPREEDRGPRRTEARESQVEPAEPPAASVGTAMGEIGEIGQFVLGALERMRLGSFELTESAEEGVVVVGLRGPGARALGGGDGRSVDALQLLANQAAMSISAEDPDRIVLDVEGDLAERESRLGELAERAAQRARETGRSIALDPMSPRDRRAIHLALREAQGVATMSVGESRYRQVVVVPEGAPEYEEALQESRAATGPGEERG